MSKEAEEWLEERHFDTGTHVARQFISPNGDPDIDFEPLPPILEAYYKHKVRKQLEEWDEEKIEARASCNEGVFSERFQRGLACGMNEMRNELLKTTE